MNLWLSQQVAPHGLYYAPDPASQQVSTIGGNVATNAGGPHCLKYGVTLNHVLGAVVVLADGTVVTLGGEARDAPDFDLLSVIVGSEGTLGIVTEICVRLLPKPEAVKTMLFDFDTVEAGLPHRVGGDRRRHRAGGDGDHGPHTVELVEQWLHLGLPLDAAAVLLIEVDGPAASLEAQARAHRRSSPQAHGTRSTRIAKDDAERAAIWKGPQVRVRRLRPDRAAASTSWTASCRARGSPRR